MNTKHTHNLIGSTGRVGAWLFGTLSCALLGALRFGPGWLVQFLDRPAPRLAAQPVRVCRRSRPTGYAMGKHRETGAPGNAYRQH